jgi:Asp-tRNA(Asn)/Glu-tRNA(Gln) amidotransferase A subunit family amidase
VAIAVGTDTGGSVRVPCALNGCAALRPTVGRYSQTGIAPISHTRDTAGPMATSVVDVALLDRVIAGGGALGPADLKGVRVGLVAATLANLDDDTKAAFAAARDKLAASGVTVLDVDMPNLVELNGKVSFPVAIYEANDDMVAYLKRGPKIAIADLAKAIASPDVKGTYDGLVLPRKLPGPDNGVVDGKPAYDAAIKTGRPALQALYRDTFAKNRLDAIIFPTTPKVAIASNPDSSSLQNFLLFIQNTDPGFEQTAGWPRTRRPGRQRPPSDCDRPCAGKAVRPPAAACEEHMRCRAESKLVDGGHSPTSSASTRPRCGGRPRACRRCARNRS